MSLKFVQINLNNSWTALDLLRQRILESGMCLTFLSEPPQGVAASNRWFYSLDKTAAILRYLENSGGDVCSLVRRGTGFVIARFGKLNVVSCYLSPNISAVAFGDVF